MAFHVYWKVLCDLELPRDRSFFTSMGGEAGGILGVVAKKIDI